MSATERHQLVRILVHLEADGAHVRLIRATQGDDETLELCPAASLRVALLLHLLVRVLLAECVLCQCHASRRARQPNAFLNRGVSTASAITAITADAAAAVVVVALNTTAALPPLPLGPPLSECKRLLSAERPALLRTDGDQAVDAFFNRANGGNRAFARAIFGHVAHFMQQVVDIVHESCEEDLAHQVDSCQPNATDAD
eukprot:CAMPEP_0171814144 /NCGR_PEP_ID=MMETSP0991-20121206/79587_1 /TAXON_ID=483369 /ORGANISM="non described non described, Strain CCMP2098" /LENGTH=199 /DNA_ID=CAMNT_0012427763 /DNA_START=278 /DNA_END=877 /DNA_ORIENTATION=-